MGVVFSWFYTSRWGRHRVMPLVIAHTLLDVVAFVGYALLYLLGAPWAGWHDASSPVQTRARAFEEVICRSTTTT